MTLQPEQVWLAVEPVDMRLGIDGLSLLVQEALGKAPCDGSAYAFRNRRQNRLKLLIWDGAGVWLGARRLHRGRFTNIFELKRLFMRLSARLSGIIAAWI